ncbi:hypothetical protein V6N11_056143 [Hibiscus sabdariffa]|uniref:Uncharacterized protein n=1 Tax=Hibiscus sabdariffa TaxID=183260 RepID=A0ABR2T2X8_9ROSI
MLMKSRSLSILLLIGRGRKSGLVLYLTNSGPLRSKLLQTQNMLQQDTSRDFLPRAERRNLKRDCVFTRIFCWISQYEGRIKRRPRSFIVKDLKPMHVKDNLECKFSR